MLDITQGLTDNERQTIQKCADLLGHKLFWPDKIHKVNHGSVHYSGRFPTPTIIVDGKGVDFMPWASNDLCFQLGHKLRFGMKHETTQVVATDPNNQVSVTTAIVNNDRVEAVRRATWRLLEILTRHKAI